MKSIIEKIINENKKSEATEATAIQAEINDPRTSSDRRSFLKKAAMGGVALGGLMHLSVEDTIAQTTQRVSRASAPADLKITDMRYAVVRNVGRTTIIRIDTNQGIYGLGEVRDGADERYALILKSRILGENPCNVEMIFKIIRKFGFHGRQGGGVCGVEMALWDLCGKAYGVPAWQLLGGRYRNKVRLYADTPETNDPTEFRNAVTRRINTEGYTWLKMDFGIGLARGQKDALVNYTPFWDSAIGEYSMNRYMSYSYREHPFTQVQLTDKTLEIMAARVEMVRNAVGYEVPISSDHFGHFDVNNSIRMGRAVDKYRLAWLEDMTQWYDTKNWKIMSDALETPTCTGEDAYCLRGGFKDVIDTKCVDIIHPDLATSGGLLETKRIGDYAQENGVAMAMHMAGTPVCFMSNVHCAAATENFLSLEHHSVDTPWWEKLVKLTGSQPMITKGFANVPLDSPGLGIELNDDVVKEHLIETDKSYFAPTPQWDDRRSGDRLWS